MEVAGSNPVRGMAEIEWVVAQKSDYNFYFQIHKCWCSSMWQSNRLVSDGLQVQLLSPAPECDRTVKAASESSILTVRVQISSIAPIMRMWCKGNTEVCQASDTSSNLVVRSRSPVAQWWSNCPTNRGLQVQILSGLLIHGSVA